MGGGSSNASFVLKAINKLFELNLSGKKLLEMASQIGSDCAFFIKNNTSFATEKADVLESIELDL